MAAQPLPPTTPDPCYPDHCTDHGSSAPSPTPRPWAVALAPTSRVLCLQHLVPLLECTPAPGCLLPHAAVLAAQTVRAKMGWDPGQPHRSSTHRRGTLGSG